MPVLAVLTVLAVLENTLPSFCLSYKLQYQETTMTVLTVLAVSAVVAVSVVTATLVTRRFPYRPPQTQENSKTQKSYSKVSFGLPA